MFDSNNADPAIKPLLINGSQPLSSDELLKSLDQEGIHCDVVHHESLRTVEDAKAIRPKTDYGHTKNLFVRNKKGKMWLLTLHEDRSVDLKHTAMQLEAGRFSFASEERLMKYLGVIPGAVSAFSILNDVTGQVNFVIDNVLMFHPKWYIHPLDNRMTVTIERKALLDFLKKRGHGFELLPDC